MTAWTDDEIGGTVWSDQDGTGVEVSAFAKTLLNDADAATARATLDAASATALAASTGSSLVGHQASGTGAVSRTSAAKMHEIEVSVTDYGAATTNTEAQNTAAFERAENALPSGGGCIVVPDGTFIVSYRIRKPYTTLRGKSWASILKTVDDATALDNDCPVRILADYCTVENLQINGNKAGNPDLDDFDLGRQCDGVAIYANYANVSNNYIHDTIGHKCIVWNEAFTDDGGVSDVGVTSPTNLARFGCKIINNLVAGVGQRGAIDIASTQGSGKVNHDILIEGNHVYDMNIISHGSKDLDIVGNVINISAQGTQGIDIHTGSTRINISGNLITAASQGIYIDGSTVACDRINISGNTVYHTAGVGINLSQSTNINCRDNLCVDNAIGLQFDSLTGASFCGNVIETPTGRGIFQSTSLLSTRVKISGNQILSPASHGMELTNLTDSDIEDNYIYNTTSATQGGIVDTNTSAARLRVSGNRINTTTSTGILINAANSLIQGNILQNVTGDAMRLDAVGLIVQGNQILSATGVGIRTMSSGATGCVIENNYVTGAGSSVKISPQTDTRVRNNVGWVTENSGTGSIASGATTATVTHGLSVTPTLDDISIVFGEQGTNDYGRFWVDTLGATTFKVNVSADPGASNLDFAWRVMAL